MSVYLGNALVKARTWLVLGPAISISVASLIIVVLSTLSDRPGLIRDPAPITFAQAPATLQQ